MTENIKHCPDYGRNEIQKLSRVERDELIKMVMLCRRVKKMNEMRNFHRPKEIRSGLNPLERRGAETNFYEILCFLAVKSFFVVAAPGRKFMETWSGQEAASKSASGPFPASSKMQKDRPAPRNVPASAFCVLIKREKRFAKASRARACTHRRVNKM